MKKQNRMRNRVFICRNIWPENKRFGRWNASEGGWCVPSGVFDNSARSAPTGKTMYCGMVFRIPVCHFRFTGIPFRDTNPPCHRRSAGIPFRDTNPVCHFRSAGIPFRDTNPPCHFRSVLNESKLYPPVYSRMASMASRICNSLILSPSLSRINELFFLVNNWFYIF